MIGKKINQLATELAPVSTDLTIIGDPISGVSKKITLAQLGAIFSGAVSFYTNLASFPAVGDINVIYCAKDTQKLYLWSGSAYVEVFPSQALLNTYQLRSEKGVSNGYASLDSGGKVPISQLPSSIMEYKGMWNAATNTPTLANGTGDTGDVYICNVAGTVNFGAGPITFAVGDYLIYSASIWQRSSGAVGTVTSVGVTRSGDALAITGSPITTSGTINLGFAGTSLQYINGAGNLVTFPGIISQAQNLVTEVYNKTGATLTKGTVVYISGGQGNLPSVTKALATGDSTSAQTYGIVQNDITNNNNGFVVAAGRLSDLDTQAFTEGTQLYLSSTTAGTYTSTKQYAPAHLVYIAIVVRAHPTQGVIEVKIQNGYEMDELHNVAAQSPDNNDILQYKTATSLWTKVAGTTTNIAEGTNLYYTDVRVRSALSFAAGSGAYNSTTGVITIPTNNNQITNGSNFITLGSLSAGAGISYNNTTGVIASTITQYTDAMARASISSGTGISYNSTTGVITNTITQYTDALARASVSLTTTGTSGAATYNSTTGVFNIPNYAPDLSGYVPTSRTITINGTSFDLSANRSYSVGTVTSVGLSAPTGFSVSGSPVTSSGTLALSFASGYSLPTNASQTTWDTAYNRSLTAASVSGTTTKTLTLTKQDGSTLTATWTDDNTDAVTSVFGRTGAVVATSGDYNTSQVTENTNLYFTNARAIASTLTGYTSGAGTISATDTILSAIQKLNGNIGALTTGVSSVNGLTGAVTLTTSNIAEGTNLYYTEARVNANTNVAANTAARHNAVTIGTANGLSLSTQVLSLALASGSTTGALSSTDWNTFNNKTSNTGTVTSVGLSSVTSGVTIGSTPITTSGTITLAIATASGLGQGLLSSTDWTTFNNKQNALTNPVTGSGTNNFIPKFTTTGSTIGNSQIFDNGTNVGIGASTSPTNRLTVIASNTGTQVTTAPVGKFVNTGNEFSKFIIGSDNANYDAVFSMDNNATLANTKLRIYIGNGTNSTAGHSNDQIVLTGSGNLGLGVTPSAWWSGARSLQIGLGGSIAARTSSDFAAVELSANQIINTSAQRVYIGTGFASLYEQFDGTHKWLTAPSGTAGNAISFTQAMTLNASGNLSVGNTNDSFKLDVSGTGRFTGALTVGGALSVSGAYEQLNGSIKYIYDSGNVSYYSLQNSSTSFLLRYNGADRLTIASTGAATFSSSVGTTALNMNNMASLGSIGGGSIYLPHTAVIMFRTTDGATARAKITADNSNNLLLNSDNGGNVGIGTTSPLGNLEVRGANRALTSDGILQVNTNNSHGINIGGSLSFGGVWTGTSVTEWSQISGRKENATDGNYAGYLAFCTRPMGGDNTERMRITSGGNVEINTGSIKTGEPDTGWGRAAVKIGASVSGISFNTTRYLPVSVDGTVYYINLNSSTP